MTLETRASQDFRYERIKRAFPNPNRFSDRSLYRLRNNASMNLELIYTISIVLTAFALAANIAECNRVAVVLFFLAAVGYGFATGWWAYGRYHGVF